MGGGHETVALVESSDMAIYRGAWRGPGLGGGMDMSIGVGMSMSGLGVDMCLSGLPGTWRRGNHNNYLISVTLYV